MFKKKTQDSYVSTSEQDKSPGPFMLEWLRMEGDHVWYSGDTMNQEAGDPDLLLSSCDSGQVTSTLWASVYSSRKLKEKSN